MSLSDVAIKRPVFTSMMSVCLLVLGVMGLKRLGTDLFPDVSFPVVTVTTVYRGAGPGEIENQVVKPIEDAVAGISGIDKIHSFSRENAGVVLVQFKLSENLDRAVQEVRDKVASVTNKLPKDADAPLISRVDIGASPILTYAMSSSLDSQRTRKMIEDRLQPALQQLGGVAEVRVTGGDVRAIIVEVVKQPGSNTVDVADQTKAKLAEVGLALGHDFKTTLLIDQSELIRANAEEVYVALFFGGAMAVLIILLFLLDPRGTFISSLALPTSVIGTFFGMFLLGYTLNQMTLLALSLAIGLLIDDAVVVREAITHRLDTGEEPAVAASRGTKDVGLAVLATTLSLVAVFVPVAFMPGIVGQFFKQFGLTISAAVLISLFISFTLDPMLSARLAKQRKPGEVMIHTGVALFFHRMFESWERFYEKTLGWVLDNKWKTVGITVAILALSGVAATRIGAEFASVEDHDQMMA